MFDDILNEHLRDAVAEAVLVFLSEEEGAPETRSDQFIDGVCAAVRVLWDHSEE